MFQCVGSLTVVVVVTVLVVRTVVDVEIPPLTVTVVSAAPGTVMLTTGRLVLTVTVGRGRVEVTVLVMATLTFCGSTEAVKGQPSSPSSPAWRKERTGGLGFFFAAEAGAMVRPEATSARRSV